MGFVRGNILPILKEHAARPFSGHCLCLGQADVYFTYETLQRIADIARIHLVPDIPITYSYRPELAVKKYISRETLFHSIGFAKISALDYSDFEESEYLFDLNLLETPSELMGQFDAVINHGTMEHVFHVPNCLANIFKMLKVGGRVIHSAPSSNFIDHGFYMFSPTLFNDYYSANKWVIQTIQVARTNPANQEFEAPFFADYEPGMLDHVSNGGLDAAAYGTIVIAEKTGESTANIIPQQGFYKRLAEWDKELKTDCLAEFSLMPPFKREIGNCWLMDLAEYGIEAGDNSEMPRGSPLKLIENGITLKNSHSIHDLIRTHGKGCYSHWNNTLMFSTSDNTDPNTNGRHYKILAVKLKS